MSEALTAREDMIFADLCACDRILVLIHRNPDGDALGTGFALLSYLKGLGKTVSIACDGKIPKRLRFLTQGKDTLVPAFEPETVVSVDTATTEMLGESLQKYAASVVYSIDHHFTNTLFAAHNIVVGSASSAGEVLCDLLCRAGALDKIGTDAARFLYTAIASDTGCFKYANTSPKTLRLAATLMEGYEIPTADINRLLFDLSDIKHLVLEGYVKQRVHSYYNGYLAVADVPLALVEKCGVEESDCDGLVAIPRCLDTSFVSVLLRERSDGSVRLSLRSETDDVDVSAVAGMFGGGGHKRASGCTIQSSLEEAEAQIVKAFGKVLGR